LESLVDKETEETDLDEDDLGEEDGKEEADVVADLERRRCLG